MANLRRLRDTENKMIIRAIPTAEPYKKLQVWTNDDWSKLYVYRNSQYIELDTSNNSVVEYWHVRKELEDQTVGYYLTDNPTNLYNRDEGDDVTYTFKDYDWTVLKTGKLEEGETPTPPADPTRSATAQYTYTFAGWNPTVWPISKKTTYTATYTATVNKYTITATSSDADLWTVSPASVANVEYGTALTVADNVITVGTWESAPTITATAGEWNTFTGWLDWRTGLLIPSTVTGDITVEAEFTAPTPTFTLQNQWFYDATSEEIRFFAASWSDTNYVACSVWAEITIDVTCHWELDAARLYVDDSEWTWEPWTENVFFIWLSPTLDWEVADYIMDTVSALNSLAVDATGTFDSLAFSAMQTMYTTPSISNMEACDAVATDERIIKDWEE